ncbi:unnamed protein product [Cuscuta epithymum]|uniref:oligopeptidase A n=1 Tax=Cuscuta epithymum TaxID=186058 RepID=A0AAV0DB87_9ASTE|nr:unnamed protein product [Cuscuta epithymum]
MATLDQAQKLLQTLRNAYWDLAVTDVQDLKDFCKHQGAPEANDFNHWDIMFWTERLRESKYELYEEQLREYFSLPMVLDGLFELANKLFGIHVKAADGSTPVWHKDVRCFSVWEGSSSSPDSTPIAHFYLDPYSRPSDKRGGSWMYPVVGRSRALPADCAGLPVAYILCNLMPPIRDKPCLMTLGDVKTLFHEFGHVLQHTLTTQDEGLVAGMKGIEMDAIELPSQFMENWCYHRKTLMGMAKHYETGESLPKAIYKKLLAARNFCSGTRTLPQIEDAIVDLELHSKYIPDGSESIFYVHKRVCERTRVLPPFPDDKSLCGFQHIFNGGYEAGYYGYQWSKVLSADAFSAFEDVGLENEKEVQRLGRRFRETVLALGGGKHPLEIFIDFRGREPSMEPLLRHNGLLHYANHSVQSNPHTINCTYAISWRLVYISLMILFTYATSYLCSIWGVM